MAKKTSNTLIGLFVLGAVCVSVAALLIFGSGSFFEEKEEYILYFDGSVKGLNVGSPVMFRGVKVGYVKDIHLALDEDTLNFVIPVLVEIDREGVEFGDGFRMGSRELLGRLVDKGLRAQLNMQSIVTGQLFINLDFYEDKPARLVGRSKKYPEIPTIPTTFQQAVDMATRIIEELRELPIGRLIDSSVNLLDRLEALVGSEEAEESIAALNTLMAEARATVAKINERVGPLSDSLAETSAAARSMFREAEKTVSLEEGPARDLIGEMEMTVRETRTMVEQARQTFVEAETLVGGDSRLHYELQTTMEELAAAARSVRLLADYLERHPDALVYGKSAPAGGE